MEQARYGFFAQALGHMPGYIHTATLFAQNFKNLPHCGDLLYRSHPREAATNAPQAIDVFRVHGINVIKVNDAPIKETLLQCDVVVTLFSHCLYECIELNQASDKPLITPVSLFFDPEVLAHYHRAVGQIETSYHRSGAILPVDDADNVLEKLTFAASDQCRQNMWQAAKNMPEVTDAR